MVEKRGGKEERRERRRTGPVYFVARRGEGLVGVPEKGGCVGEIAAVDGLVSCLDGFPHLTIIVGREARLRLVVAVKFGHVESEARGTTHCVQEGRGTYQT